MTVSWENLTVFRPFFVCVWSDPNNEVGKWIPCAIRMWAKLSVWLVNQSTVPALHTPTYHILCVLSTLTLSILKIWNHLTVMWPVDKLIWFTVTTFINRPLTFPLLACVWKEDWVWCIHTHAHNKETMNYVMKHYCIKCQACTELKKLLLRLELYKSLRWWALTCLNHIWWRRKHWGLSKGWLKHHSTI